MDSIQAAYQAKQGLQEAESFTATSKDSGKTTVFKSKSNRDAAIKAGTHEKAAKGGDSPPAGNDTSKADKPNMFSKDTGYDAGGEAKEEPLNVTDDFIDSLKSQYKNVSKQTPEQEKELETTLDKLDKKQLKKLAFSDINVVSDIASKKWYKLSYPSDDEPKKDKSEPSTSDSIDNAYDAKDFKSTVKSLKGKVSDEDYNEIKDNLKALANLQYDLGDIDRDEDNEEWGMQKDTIDVEVDDLKGLITKAIDNQVDKNGVPLKAIDKDLDNSFDEPTKIPSKYDDSSFWKDDEKNDSTGIDHYDGDSGEFYDDDDDDEYGGGSTEATKQTAERLDKIDKALDYELNLSRSGFSMDRSSSGGSGGFEGPLTISHENADFDNPENSAQLSIGSGENNGKFTIGFTDLDGQPLFDGDYSLTDDDFEPQDTHKMAKAIMKMPEVDKLLKGELSPEEFKPIYAKLKSKFNKSSKNEGKSSLVEGKSYKDRFKYLANIK